MSTAMDDWLRSLLLVAAGLGLGWIGWEFRRHLLLRFASAPLTVRFEPDLWQPVTAIGEADLIDAVDLNVGPRWDSAGYLDQTLFLLSITNHSDSGVPREVVVEELFVDLVRYQSLAEFVRGHTLLRWEPAPVCGEGPSWPDPPLSGAFTLSFSAVRNVKVPVFRTAGPLILMDPLTLSAGRRAQLRLRCLFASPGLYELQARLIVTVRGKTRTVTVKECIRLVHCDTWGWLGRVRISAGMFPQVLSVDGTNRLLSEIGAVDQRLRAAYLPRPPWTDAQVAVYRSVEPPT